MKRCAWCRNLINPKVDGYVTTKQRLIDDGHLFERFYHAKACYLAWREFVELHEYAALVSVR